MTVGSGESASHFALHIDTLVALEYVVPLVLKDKLGFMLAVHDDRGAMHAAMIGPGIPVRFVFHTSPRPKADEERVKTFLEHARSGRLDLQIPAVDVDNMPML
ncbi:hypothetical protein [Dermabacter sp. HSID17554]|uniref:hypothetical protein n=1 Tax=Dermabacter sp. HSID17554 TaxID=2419511 RepID=UPI000F87B022|nr:hypothetical protein [Dermabacter sp. HSID17554]RUP86724.1 hypothetical protein D8M36_04975 [Dermabacter sp. HSID17554]